MFAQTILFSLLGLALCAPVDRTTHLAPLRRQTTHSPAKYIINFHDNSVSPSNRTEWLTNVLSKAGLISAKEVPQAATTHWSLVNGLSATLDDEAVKTLRAQAEVKFVEEDVVMKKSATLVAQTNAPWGLARLSTGQSPITLTKGLKVDSTAFPFTFDTTAGLGVNIYVVDTGVRIDHQDFGDRATFLGSFGDGKPGVDVDGHGTHVAGTSAGAFFGVAKRANIFAVKVLDDEGTGSTSDIISGLDLVLQHHSNNSTQPAVVNLSLGGSHSDAFDTAVRALVNAGITVVVAAGNDGRDVGDDSPAAVQEVITVGAMNIKDTVPDFSDFGPKVDIFAPGDQILSLSPASTKATRKLSGTSMASPHVAGLAATILALDPTLEPAQVKRQLVKFAVSGVIKAGLNKDTVNLIASINAFHT